MLRKQTLPDRAIALLTESYRKSNISGGISGTDLYRVYLNLNHSKTRFFTLACQHALSVLYL